MNMDYLK